MYYPPAIESGHGASRQLKGLPGPVLVVTMDIPWRLVYHATGWRPDHVHFVESMDYDAVQSAERALPACAVVVGVGGGSCVDMAKFIAWKRGCRMVLVPTIVSVDAPLTNTIAVRVQGAVRYIGDIYPREIIVDYDLIRQAPPELNRAGACDIASVHTALYDWKLAHAQTGEPYSPEVAAQAEACLNELNENAAEIHAVSPKGVDTLIDLFRREVEFCARLGTSRPEEGSEHIVAYALEHETGRHFIHGDLVSLGIFLMSRLQGNRHEWVVDLMRRLGLRYRCQPATPEEVRACILNLKQFKDDSRLFFSIVDVAPITPEWVDDTLAALYA